MQIIGIGYKKSISVDHYLKPNSLSPTGAQVKYQTNNNGEHHFLNVHYYIMIGSDEPQCSPNVKISNSTESAFHFHYDPLCAHYFKWAQRPWYIISETKIQIILPTTNTK